MTRRFAAAALLLIAGLAQAQPPATLPAVPPAEVPGATTDLRKPQEQNAKLFKELSLGLLRLAQKLEKSDRPEDVERAKTIRAALKVAEEAGVETQFQKLIGGLGKGTNRLPELEQLAGQDAELGKALQQIVEILMTDDESARLKAEIAKLTEMLKEVKDIKRREEIIRAMTEAQKGDAAKIAKTQEDLARQTKDLMDRMAGKKPGEGKAGEPKPAESKPEDPAEPKAEPKEGDKPGEPKPGEGKPGEPKDGKGKPGEGSPAGAKPNPAPPKPGQPNPSNGQPKPGQPKPPADADAQTPQQQNQTPGRKQVQEAYPNMEQAKKDLDKNDRQNASKKESKAIDELQKAIEELEKRLRQLREEEMLKALAALEARCNRMLAMQIDVYENTKAVHSAVVKNGNMKTTADIQKSQQQSGKEGEIVAEADRAMKLLESEGSAVAFAKVLEEVRGDMVAVQKRLDAAYVDGDTQAIEENIIAMLKDMVAALKKAQQDIEANKNQNQNNQQQQRNQNQLIDILSELRLIRAMQVQVNQRTAMYGKKSPGEQASDPIIRDELKQLSGRQARLQDMIQKIATKMNQ